MNMNTQEVAQIVGYSVDGLWQQMNPNEISQLFNMKVVGGSTAKPTSTAKKQEAIQVGQVLGQFAGVAPQATEVMLKLFEQSFDEIVIKEEDWTSIREGIAQTQQQSVGGNPQGNPQQGSNPQGQQQAGQSNPQIEQAVQQATAKGMPEELARQMIQQRMQ